MQIWSAEIKELETLYTSIKGQFPDLEKELEQLIETKDANVILIYSRRCLEVIVTDLCECELKRPRRTEPLRGIIDKLSHEEKVPSHITVSMQYLNSLSAFGAHPKEFDPEQVKPVLNNLVIIIKWYLKYKDAQTTDKTQSKETRFENIEHLDTKKGIHISKKKLIIFSGLLLVVIIIVVALFVLNIIGGGRQTENTEKSVAVLPFVNLSNDPEQEYFSDGMVDEILDHLYKIGELKVISRTSSMRYKNTDLSLKEIAHELGVSAILEGSVRKIGNNVRITVQLIDTKTDTHLWSETYDEDLSDVFSIQSQVAQNVARELKATLTSKENVLIQNASLTTSQLAYDFYLKGNDYWSRSETFLALDMYSKAIQEDSLFTVAYAQRAKTHIYIFWEKYQGFQGHDLSGREDIKKGLQINPESPEMRFAEAVAYYQLDRNYDKSLKILTELKAIEPNMAELYAYSSYVLRRQGKIEESINELKRAIQLDPFNASDIDNLSQNYPFLHQYDKGIESARQGLSLIPDYKNFRNLIFWYCRAKTGDLQVSLAESGLKEEDVQNDVYYYTRQYDKLIEFISKEYTVVTTESSYAPKTYQFALIYYLSGNSYLSKIYADSAIIHLKEEIKDNPYDDRFYSTLGKCYAFSGNVKEAIACGKKAVNLKPVKLDALRGKSKEQDLMEIYIFTGNYDLALDKIEYLLSVPSWLSVGEMKINPVFDKLRSLPRFQKIIDSTKN
jgi:TolB-like protein